MSTLTKAQKNRVILQEPRMSPQRLAEIIQKYDNLSIEDFPNMPDDRKKAIEDILRESGQEEEDWQQTDCFSKESLIGFIKKYPGTQHRDEIDNLIWDVTNKEDLQELSDYLALFPKGAHADEASEIQRSFVNWTNIRDSDNIVAVNDWIEKYPDSPWIQKARSRLNKLKREEIYKMKSTPNAYSSSFLKNLIDKGIFTNEELIEGGVVTSSIIQIIKDTDFEKDLPDINIAIEKSTADCKEGYTDVFFFGVPSTGKTCVLMGLSQTRSLNINLVSGGGDYAAALQQYTDKGVTVPRTPGTFVTSLEGTIRGKKKSENDVVHKVNLIEMSGEEFAFGIANNEDRIFKFEDIGGSKAVELLKNDNHKVFFIIIDPTANTVHIDRDKYGIDPASGRKYLQGREYCTVNQKTILQKMVNLFESSDNSEIMKKVDSIHFIMTKSDTMGDGVEREDKARKIFYSKFRNDILDPLVDLCKEYNINANTKFYPKLYTFSLGTFYVAGFYEYDSTDSERLVVAIKNSTRRIRKLTLWDKIKKKVN